MTPEQFQRVKDLFLEAIQQPPELRQQFARERCGDDAEGLRELLAMLAEHRDDASVIAETLPPQPEASIVRESLGSMIGRYKLLQQIGEGGMGVVYMAEQETPVRRRVALKIIKPGMDSGQVIARFEAERQALAMMDHPNIAKVFDAGTTDAGRPYFVMELVQGVPITQYCDGKKLTPRQRLELFVPVCQAIQHAHQKGIIHRDLKPSNVMVMIYDGKPVPKVIDFGIAKALHQRLTEKTVFTQFGGMIGTPEYMSPEQTELDMLGTDTRSDIYTLGVLLYELLTGTTPLEIGKIRDAGYEKMMQTIRDQEPPKPSTRLSYSGDALASISASRGTEPGKLTKLMAGDLDWIVMKALEKDRLRRYETADGLAQDIQRYMSDEPVEASPPSATYRLRKLARKHRAALRVAAAFMLLLLGSAVVSSLLAVHATRAQRAADAARGIAEVERGKADTARIDAAVAQRQSGVKVSEAMKGAWFTPKPTDLGAFWGDAVIARVLLRKAQNTIPELGPTSRPATRPITRPAAAILPAPVAHPATRPAAATITKPIDSPSSNPIVITQLGITHYKDRPDIEAPTFPPSGRFAETERIGSIIERSGRYGLSQPDGA